MNLARSPISILQEIAQTKHLPFPVYYVTVDVTGFKCIGQMNNLTATAVAPNKKCAKRLCAENLLKMIQSESGISGFTLIPIHNEPNINAIGKLNELCSQHGVPYPDYSELGVINQKFVIGCKLLSYTTQGEASTKKMAKQIAANEMLSRVQSDDFAIIEKCKREQSDLKSAELEKIIKLYEALTRDKREPKIVEIDNVDSPLLPIKINEDLIDFDVTEEELKARLAQMNISYEIGEIQKSPLVLKLETKKTKDHPSYTFLQTGPTYEAAVCELLKKCAENIVLLYK